jgi:hypothetical protein
MMLTVDGVYQGPGGADEDRRGRFEGGGWTAAHPHPEMWPFLTSWFERADALLRADPLRGRLVDPGGEAGPRLPWTTPAGPLHRTAA